LTGLEAWITSRRAGWRLSGYRTRLDRPPIRGVLVKFIGIDAAYDRIDPETVSWRKK
jgi:hypothetical protein